MDPIIGELHCEEGLWLMSKITLMNLIIGEVHANTVPSLKVRYMTRPCYV